MAIHSFTQVELTNEIYHTTLPCALCQKKA